MLETSNTLEIHSKGKRHSPLIQPKKKGILFGYILQFILHSKTIIKPLLSRTHISIPQKTLVVVESRVVEWLCQEVGMMHLRLYMGNTQLHLRKKIRQKIWSHVDVLRVRREHWVLCQVPCPLIILENRDERLPNARKRKPPYIAHEHHHLNGVSLCYRLGLSGRKRNAFLHYRQPAHTPPHTS